MPRRQERPQAGRLYPPGRLCEIQVFTPRGHEVTRGKGVEVRGQLLRFIGNDGRIRTSFGFPFQVAEVEPSYTRVLDDDGDEETT